MIKNLDIDLYTDGFDVSKMDCLNNPVAAATGYFNRDNYFYYALLNGILYNSRKYNEYSFFQRSKLILEKMGYAFEAFQLTQNKQKNIDSIVQCLSDDCPIILVVKYNALFFNSYYGNLDFKSNHALIVNAINTDNGTVKIKEVTLLRDLGILHENVDIHYQLQITLPMLFKMLEDSNKQFLKENSEFYNQVFFVKEATKYNVPARKVMNECIDFLQADDDELLDIIQNDDGKISLLQNYKYNRLRFYGSYYLIYKSILHIVKANHIAIDKISFWFEKMLAERDLILKNLYIMSKRGKNLDCDTKTKYTTQICIIKKAIAELLIDTLPLIDTPKSNVTFIDISKYYNNKAFETEIKDSSVADITGEGTHFLMENISQNKEIERFGSKFFYYKKGTMDNVSCQGQVININNVLTSKIELLFCSEYGSYHELLSVEYSDGRTVELEIKVSDFYQPAIFGEKLIWTGPALDRKNGMTKVHSFAARLFAQCYDIPLGNIVAIKLPIRKNIHIFAISLLD